ncbi:MAG: LPS export ABC transporter permease LptF [Pseudomonadota bacterium]
MKIIYRYLIKEILVTSIMVLLILVFILICGQLMQYLSAIAKGQLTLGLLFKILSVQMPILFSLLSPLGLFIGILLVYSRLYSQSEMVVMFAGGLSKLALLRFTLIFSLIVALIVGFMVSFVNPNLEKQREQLLFQAASTMLTQKILPGKFQSIDGGSQVYYAGSVSRDHKDMRNIFFARKLPPARGRHHSEGASWSIIVAQDTHQQQKDGKHFLVAENGYRYQGVPGSQDYQITHYKSYGFQLQTGLNRKKKENVRMMSTIKLLPKAFSVNNYAGEFQWRLSVPIAVLLLGLFAVPLSEVNPRKGRFANLFAPLLFVILYINMLYISVNWISEGVVPIIVGIWWLHLIMILSIIIVTGRWLGWRFLGWRR